MIGMGRMMGLEYLRHGNKMEWAFVLLAFAQIETISWLNLTQLKAHLGTDAASCYANAMAMWERGSLFLTDWIYPTTLNIDSVVSLAALLYGFCGDIFLAYGMANILFTGLLVMAFSCLLRQFEISFMGSILAVNLLLGLHFVSYDPVNSLSYASVLFLDGGFYSFKMLLSLAILVKLTEFSGGGDPMGQRFRYPYICRGSGKRCFQRPLAACDRCSAAAAVDCLGICL